jgi:putative transposase
MPDHVHLLLNPTSQDYDVSEVFQSIKEASAKRATRWLKEYRPQALPQLLDIQPNGRAVHRIWERGGGHDRNVTTPETVHAEIEYIHNNPVRKGLCDRPEDWFWSSASDFAGRRDGPVPVDLHSIPKLEK